MPLTVAAVFNARHDAGMDSFVLNEIPFHLVLYYILSYLKNFKFEGHFCCDLWCYVLLLKDVKEWLSYKCSRL